MIEGRRADSARRRERVVKALNEAIRQGESLSVSAVARRVGVDRTFFYRHRDLLAQIHAAEAAPAVGLESGAQVTRASLQADLANAQDRNVRLTARVRQLEDRLSELLGDQAWKESGLGATADIEELQRQIVQLEQTNVELTGQLEERQAELDAARGANRELTRALNQARS
ncbi:DUF6262 family protein [Streptomyces sp. TRM70350]|uniref:DUF6262 family protein n=1 Tax=Streptomyces sp. TRM70350 TaxID=2856165 RepID=UPI001C441D98|nr:DUF6262 family protein [Streptomyces sp. TRM70350]MBV7698760.1 hypothetical protein [Streptomyces sp. TRM70350]